MFLGTIRSKGTRIIFVLGLLLIVLSNSVFVTGAAFETSVVSPATAVVTAADGNDHNLYDDALAALTADQPRFEVAAVAAAVPLNQGGEWGDVIVWPHTPVSIANLPDGRILTWSGSEREHWPGTEQTYSAVWDPATNSFVENFYEGHNMFCSDLVSLEDGRILALGGRNTVDKVSAYDFSTNTWTPLESMNTRRWYPTSMMLGNGDVFTAVGKGGRYPERYTVGEGWSLLTGADLQGPILDYGTNKDGAGWWPLMHLDPRGQVFHYGATPQMHAIDPTGNGGVTPLGANNFSWFPEEAVAIMYAEGKILVAGGAVDSGTNTSSAKSAIIDITNATPVVTEIGPMNIARQFQNEVVLPNGDVVIIGGNTSGQKFSDNGAVLEPEIWNPTTQAWTLGNPMDVPRNYHSTAILLPDGRILSAGGGYSAGNPDHPATHTDGQVYTPPYLFNADGTLATRPAISTAPEKVNSGEQFAVTTSSEVSRFTMIRMSATTHTMNTGQRLVEVPFTGSNGNYQLTAHSNTNVLVPGHWMLFALDAAGVPSEAHLVQVNVSGKPWVIKPADKSTLTGSSDSVTLDAGDTEGDTLSFAATDLPAGITIDPNTGEMSGTPNSSGVSNVVVTVSDDQGQSRETRFTWTVTSQGVTREWWNGIGGTAITELTNNANYPDNPSGVDYLTAFEGPVNWADNYASRIHGYIVAPETGDYTFWISSDDNGELWLSNSEDPTDVVRIAHVPGWSASRQWTKYAEQQSAAISLVAGERYYLSALMNEGGGGDNLAVAWQRPGQAGQEVISAAYASPYIKPVSGDYRYVRLVTQSEVAGNPWASAAEFYVLDSNGTVIGRDGWSVTATSEELAAAGPNPIANAIDGDSSTNWHTEWRSNAGDDNDPAHPHEVVIDMGSGYDVGGFRYLPRQDGGVNGTIAGYALYVSNDGTNWILASDDSFGTGTAAKTVTFTVDDQLILQGMSAQPEQVGVGVSYTAVSSAGRGTVQYRWSFGDGTSTTYSESATVGHTYSQPGRYLVTLTATDETGEELSTQFVQAVYGVQTANRPTHSSSLIYETNVAGDRIWNVNPDNNSVSVVDAATNNKVAEIAVGNGPRTLAQAPNGRIWVTNFNDASLTIIDQTTLTVLNTINLARGSAPYGLAFSASGDAGYVALAQSGQLLKLDPVSGATVASLDVGRDVHHLSIAADGGTVYLSRFITPRLPGEETATVQTNGVGGEVVVVNASAMSLNNTLILQVDTGSDFEAGARGVPNYLAAMVIAPDGQAGWVPSKEDNILRGQLRDGNDLTFEHTVRAVSSYVNLNSGQEEVSFRVDHDNSSVGRGAAFGRYGNYLFVALETSREVSVVDAYSRAELFRIGTGRAPQSVVVSPDGLTLYVHNFMDRSVGVYDLSVLVNTGVFSAPFVTNIDAVATELLTDDVLSGKQLFYDAGDTRLALDGYMSCASCHQDGADDGRVWDFTGFGEGLRNTIALNGHGDEAHGPLHWTANFNEVHDFEGQIRALNNGTGLMSDADFAATSDPLAADKAGLSADLDALAAYVDSLITFGDSPNRNEDGTLTAEGEAGRTVFQTTGCASCHNGTAFTDSALLALHDVGTIEVSSGGRIGGQLTGFDTPTLRGLWETAPYLHNGSALTLGEAVNAHSGVEVSGADLDALVSYLNQIDDSEPAPIVESAGPQLAHGTLAAVGDDWQTVTLDDQYSEMVVVATVQMDTAALPAVTRVRNATGNQFEVRVQNPSGQPLSGYVVHYVVAEAGVYTAAEDGITMEAVTYNATVTDRSGSWVGESRSYGQSYSNPVVLGQVMTFNDSDWSAFWAYGSARTNPPDSSNLNLGKNVAQDSNTARAAETIGYIVLEAGSGSIDGVAYEAAVGTDTVVGFNSNVNYSHGLGMTPDAVILSTSGLDGGDGGWPALNGLDRITGDQFGLIFDEDQIGDSERNHTSEQIAYVAFRTETAVDGDALKLAHGVVSGVGNSWQTITLPQSYTEMVVIATAEYDDTFLPAVTRIQNASGNSFELQVQHPGDQYLNGYIVHYIVVEAGVYTVAEHGVKLEAVRVDSTVTDRRSNWVGEAQSYGQGYNSPVVLGQVMSANDAAWSVFWARGSSRTNVPDSGNLFVGKHVAEDSNTTRATETLGYIVVEASSGLIGSISFEAGVGSDTVQGIGNSAPYSYGLAGQGQTAVLSSSAMDGNDGGWPVLYSTNPLAGGQLALAIDEDQIRDSERSHTSEQAAYFVIR